MGGLKNGKKRYNVKNLRICGESGDVQGPTIDSWKERLPELLCGFTSDDIWNMDETGLFWKALPDRGFVVKGRACKGGKKVKERFTVAFFVTAAGKKEKPIVIWKSENPRCLKRFDKSLLPVDYYSQKSAWMNGAIMEEILSKLNRRLSRSSRFILLLIDNAGCHPDYLQGKFSNIKVYFLPANTTSMLQPLDLGIIQNFKVHYRNYFLRHVLAKIDESTCASEVCKSITVLVAIRWVAMAWALVQEEMVRKCFRKAGVLQSNLSVVERSEQDPFLEADECGALQDLISTTMSSDESCEVGDYLTGENSLPVCAGLDDSDWESSFFAELNQEQEPNEEQEEDDEIEHSQMIKTYKDANAYLEELHIFFEKEGHIEEALQIGSIMDKVSLLSSKKQTTLDSWLIH